MTTSLAKTMATAPFVRLLTLSIILGHCFSTLPPSPPSFSWDTIPLFMHAANQSGPLNDTAAKYMATFPIATVEKFQDSPDGTVCTSTNEECEEDKIIAALKKIRSYSSGTRTIFYLNGAINFPQYKLALQFTGENQKYLLHDKNGKLCHHSGNGTFFDFSQNETINFFLDTVKYGMTAGGDGVVDGLFLDQGNKMLSTTEGDCIVTAEFAKAWDNGHVYVEQQTQKLITSLNKDRGILIVNNADVSGVNARMFEKFQPGNETTFINEKNNRISEVHGENCVYGSSNYIRTVTAFLIGAYEGAYYAYSEGWTLQSGWDELWECKDCHKALGEPLGDASYDSKTKIYSRAFKSGTKVYIDSDWNYPCIKWSDGSITGSTDNCKRY